MKQNNKTMNFIYKVFSDENFKPDSLVNYIMENFTINTKHSLLIKFGFNNNSIFLMSGAQLGVSISDTHNKDYYAYLYNVIIFRLENILGEYNLEYEPNTVILCHKPLSGLSNTITSESSSGLVSVPSLLKFLSESDLDKSVLKISQIKNSFHTKYLPLTLNNRDLGFLIEGDLKSTYIKQLYTTYVNNTVRSPLILSSENLILSNENLINKSKIFKKEIKLRLRKINLTLIIISCSIKDYIEIYGENNIKNIIDIHNYSNLNNGYVRIGYDLESGTFLFKAIDFIVNPHVFVRYIGNYSITIKNSKIVDINRFIKLDSIKPPRFTHSALSNPNIGVLDIETFVNSKGLGQVYAMGYGTLQSLQDENIQTYYLSDFGNFNSDLLIITCINSMLESKYHKYYWYIHNMGKFDIIFIYKTLEEFNLQSQTEFYKLKTIYKDGKMLKLTVSRKLGTKTVKITFIDSYNLLSSSLDTLTKGFDVKNLKRDFPYNFVNEKTINYKGQTPDIKYFNKISTSEYKELFTLDNWSLKKESLDYLKTDILGLLEVLDKFKSDLFIEHNLDLTEGLTISRLALNKYLKSYMKNSKIPLVNKLNQFNFMYFGYYGGRTEVFKPYGTNLKYYDINSLYPKAALNNMPGLNCYYKKSTTDKGLSLDNGLFGIFKAKVKTNNNYLGLLPVKTNYGLIFPIGEYIGIWPTPELKYAKDNGYDIQIIEGYAFDEIPSYFSEYILDLYDLKSKTTGSQKSINKSLLNNLLGRFGLNIIKPISKILNKSKLDSLLSTRKINSIEEINSDAFLVNYNPLVDYDICLMHGVDYTKALTENKNFNIEKNIDLFQDVSVIIAALVTSYARVYMLQIMEAIINIGGNIYYTDTDSIITDITLDPKLVGKELGKFKLEYDIKEGYFISNKTYCLLLNNGKTIIKCKGIKNDSLTLDDFKSMYFDYKDVYGLKKSTITQLSKGSVTIENTKLLIQHNVYTKRKKVYDSKNLWVDTKPLYIDNLTKSITLYSPPSLNIVKFTPSIFIPSSSLTALQKFMKIYSLRDLCLIFIFSCLYYGIFFYH